VMDMPLAYRKTANRIQAPAENPWVSRTTERAPARPQGEREHQGGGPDTGARWVDTGGCDSAELVFDMGYLVGYGSGGNVARP